MYLDDASSATPQLQRDFEAIDRCMVNYLKPEESST